MNLLVTLDRRYLPPLAVMLKSYGAQHPEVCTDLYVAHAALEEEDFRFLEETVAGYDIRIHNIQITDRYFKDTPVLERIPEESFYRLLAFLYLPEEVDRCLYLDPDIFIRKPLLELYQMDMGSACIAAAGHMHGLGNFFNKIRLGIYNKQERYINSGVMLMNLQAIRRDFTLEKVLDCLEENAQWLVLGDQDMTNILFGSRTIFLDEHIYNLDERTLRRGRRRGDFTLEDAAEQSAIIHYNGKYKPWLEGYKGELNCFYPPVEEKGAAPSGMIQKQIRSVCRIMRPTRQQAIFLSGVACFLLICLFSYLFFGKELVRILADPASFRAWLDNFGIFDELIFILIRAVQTMVKIVPAEPLEIAAGYAWGVVPGTVYCLIGNLIGSLAILALTKHFGLRFIELFLPINNMKSLTLFKGGRRVYSLLFLLYLIPGSPKDCFTYFAGFLPVKTLPFLLLTGLARIPSIITSTLCGATLAEKNYWLSALIFAITLVLTLIGTIIYHFYAKRVQSNPNTEVIHE